MSRLSSDAKLDALRSSAVSAIGKLREERAELRRELAEVRECYEHRIHALLRNEARLRGEVAALQVLVSLHRRTGP